MRMTIIEIAAKSPRWKAAGILAAIMSSLDSQFLCLGTMFTNDIVLHRAKKEYSDKQILFMARAFIVAIVVITYILSLLLYERNVFDLAIWSFSGFAALTPLVIAALYWKRATATGAYACVAAVAITWMTLFVISDWGHEDILFFGGLVPAAVMWFIGATAMIIGSLISQPPSKKTLAKFF